jgi:hypothetical protein
MSRPPPETARASDGSAAVESVALAALIAMLALAGVAAVASGPLEGGRDLGAAIARRLRCAPALPGHCWRDPLTLAYGRSLAGAVRALAPVPTAIAGPGGLPLTGVDFRRCRSPGCAVPGEEPHLTASNRRVTSFTSVGREAGGARITYWTYRPTIGWDEVARRIGGAQIRALAATPLLEEANPVLVPLETLIGRNHFEFGPGEEPPWRWQLETTYPRLE